MANEGLPEEAPREEDPDHGGADLDACAEAPAALAVSWYLVAVAPADPDHPDDDAEPDIGPVILAHRAAELPSVLLLTPASASASASAGAGRAARPQVTELEHEGLPERLREAAASYTAENAAMCIVPADGPVGGTSDAITGWITSLAEQPARGLAVSVGVPGALATPAAGILAICVTSPVIEPVENVSKFFEVAGVIIGLLIRSHPIVQVFGQPLLHNLVSGLIKNALTVLTPAAQAYEKITPTNLASETSPSANTDWQPLGEPLRGKPTPKEILLSTVEEDDVDDVPEPASTDDGLAGWEDRAARAIGDAV
jgi:hypothetical protein